MPDLNLIINAQDKSSPAFKSAQDNITGLSNAAQATGQKFSILGNAVSVALGNTISSGIGLAVGGLKQLGQSVIGTGLDFNNMRQQSEIAFGTMLGDGAKAKTFLDDLQSFAAKTPFEFPELVSASQKMLAMGFASEEVLPMLTSIGDAVAGLGGGGEMVGRVTTALGQMQAKGKAAGGEMMQLTEAGIPAWEFLAKAMGKSVGEVMDDVSAGTVSAEMAIKSITEGMNTNFGGLMEKQSATWGGLLSTISDTFAQISGKVMGPFFTWASGQLTTFVAFLGSETMTGWIDAIVEAFDIFFGTITTGGGIIQAFGDVVSNLFPPGFFKTFEDGSGWLADFLEMVGVGEQTAQAFGTVWYNLMGIFNAVWAVIATGIDAFTQLFGTLKVGGGDFLTNFIDGLYTVTTVIENLSRLVQLIFTGDFTGGIFALAEDDAIISWFLTLHDILFGFFNMITGQQTVLETFGTIWDSIWFSVQQTFDQVTQFVTTNLPVWIATLGTWATAMWQWIADAIPVVLTTLGTFASGIISWLAGALPTFWAMMLTWQAAIVTWIGDAIPKAIDGLTKFIAGIRSQGEGSGTNQFMVMVGKWATTLWEWITKQVIPQVGPAFVSLISAMWTSGQKMLASLGGLATELGLLLWGWIQTAIPVVQQWLGTLWSTIQGLVQTYGPILMGILADWTKIAWEWVAKAIPIVRDKLGDWWSAMSGWVSGNMPKWTTALAKWGEIAWEWISKSSTVALKKLSDWGGELWGWVKDNAPSWYDKLKTWGTAAWEWIVKIAIPEAVKKLGEWGTALWGWVKENAPKWWEQLVVWGTAAWEWITKIAIPEAIKKLGEWLTGMTTWLTTNWPTWKDKMIKAGSDLMGWLWDGIEKMWIDLSEWFFSDTAFGGFVGDILSIFGAQMGPAYGVMYDHGKKITYSLDEGSRFGLDSLKKTGGDMGSSITSGLKDNLQMHSPSVVMRSMGLDIGTGLGMGMTDSIPYIQQVVNNFGPAIQDATVLLVDDAKAMGQAIGQGIGTGLKSMEQWVADQAMALKNKAAAEMQASIDYFTNKAIQDAYNKSIKIGLDPKDYVLPPPPNNPTPQWLKDELERLRLKKEAENPIPPALLPPTLGQGFLGAAVTEEQVKTGTQTLTDFIKGMGKFAAETLDTRTQSQTFWDLKNVGDTDLLRNAETRIRASMTGLIGGEFGGALGENVEKVMKSITAGSDMAKVGEFMQSLISYRTLANTLDKTQLYRYTAPTNLMAKAQSAGQQNMAFYIQLQGTGQQADNVISTVELLRSLYGTNVGG